MLSNFNFKNLTKLLGNLVNNRFLSIDSTNSGGGSKMYPMTRGKLDLEKIAYERKKYLDMHVREKREKFYKNKRVFAVQDIPTWIEYCSKEELPKPSFRKVWSSIDSSRDYAPKPAINSKISVFQGDITRLEIDAIVNAANKTLLGGGGVDGAIHDAAGDLLLQECMTLKGCETGEAKITAGYRLPAKYCIHTVGPIGKNPEKLRNSYLNSLKRATENGCRTIAFPAISTGVYGYPVMDAAQLVAETIREYLEKNPNEFERIIFCLFQRDSVEAYEQYLSYYFPIDDQNSPSTILNSKSQSAKDPVKNNERDPYDDDDDDDDNDVLSPSSSFVGKQKHTTDKQERKEAATKEDEKKRDDRDSEKKQVDDKTEKIEEKNTDKMKQTKISSLVSNEKQDKESEKKEGVKVKDTKTEKSASQPSSSSVNGKNGRRSTSTSPTKKTSPTSGGGANGAKSKSSDNNKSPLNGGGQQQQQSKKNTTTK